MCSIDEAWAGQVFYDQHVQSQADLHQKYMPISDDLLQRNNNMNAGSNKTQTQANSKGINNNLEKRLHSGINNRTYNLKNDVNSNNNNNSTISDNRQNNNNNIPIPSISGKRNFKDIENSFLVSNSFDNFTQIQEHNSVNTNNENNNENNNRIRNTTINENKQLNDSIITNIRNDNTHNHDNQYSQMYNILQDISKRIDKLDIELNRNNTRNIYDIILYIILGMLISFIICTCINKK